MDISDRRRMLLSAIITLHTQSGEPIGSKSLLDRFDISSATIRNEMAALEALGLLEQPHTSAGRVPTLDGYRYYVHNLMKLYPLSLAEEREIERAVAAMDTDPDKAAEEAARALAELTGLAAVSTTVKGANAHIVHYELIRVGRYNIAVLAVSNAGAVKSRVVRLSHEASEGELSAAETALNKRAVFIAAADVNASVRDSVLAAMPDMGGDSAVLTDGALSLIREASVVRVYTTGQQNLLRFHELDPCMKDLLEIFSDTDFLARCFERVDEPVAVYVGDENRIGGLSQVSLLLSRYRSKGGMSGGIGVAGPVRINYEYIIPRLKYFCDNLSAALTNS